MASSKQEEGKNGFISPPGELLPVVLLIGGGIGLGLVEAATSGQLSPLLLAGGGIGTVVVSAIAERQWERKANELNHRK